MSNYKWKVRGPAGTIIAYTTYKYEAEEVAAEDGGTIHRHVASNPKKKTKAQSRQEKRDFVRSVQEKYAPTVPAMDRSRYTPIAGLEGPFQLRSGKVVYWDGREGKYYDRDSDLYLEVEEYEAHTRARNPGAAVRKILEKEGGAAGIKALRPAFSDPATAEAKLAQMPGVMQHKTGDYALTDGWNTPRSNPDHKWRKISDDVYSKVVDDGSISVGKTGVGGWEGMYHPFGDAMEGGFVLTDSHSTLAAAKKSTLAAYKKFMRNPRSNPDHKWVQAVDEEIEERGTEGAFTKQARRAGYKDTMEFARKVMAGWRSGKKTVYNKKTRKQQKITKKTMYRANFAINVQKRNPADSVKSEDFYRGALSGAAEKGASPPGNTASSAYRKGYTYGAKLAKSSPEQVAKAVGYFHATSDISGAGRYLVEETEEVLSRERNPTGWTKAKTEPSSASLQGPFVASGAVGPVKAGSKFFYSPSKSAFYDPVTKRYFSVKLPTKKVQKSEKRIEREKLEKSGEELQLAVNNYRRALSMEMRALGRTGRQIELALAQDPRIKDMQKDLKAIDKEIAKLKPRQAPAFKPKKRKPGKVLRGTLVKGYEPVVMEYQPGSGKIFVTFDERSSAAPIVRDLLNKYTPDTPAARGEFGYWQVGIDDLPSLQLDLAASDRLAEVWRSDIGLTPSPNARLRKELRKLDSRARRTKRQKLLHAADKPPRPGIDTITGKKVEFQDDGIRFLMSRNRAVLADDMGLGKTYQAIVAAQTAIPKGEQILILCPAAVVGNWKADIEDFVPGTPVSIVTSTARVGGDDADPKNVDPGNYSLKKDGDPPRNAHKLRFVIASYQGAASRAGDALLRKWLLSYGRDGNKKWGLIICDEAHRLKKAKTLGHRFVANLDTKRLWMLTGTPIANRPRDLFGVLKLGQHPLGDNEAKFMQEFTLERRGGGVVADPELLPRLGNLLSGFMLRRTKADVLKKKLPAKVGGLQRALDPAIREGVIRAPMPRDFLFGPSKSRGETEKLRRQLAIVKAPVTWDIALRSADAGKKVVLFSTYTSVLDSFGKLAEEEGLLYVEVRGATSLLGKKVSVAMFQGDTLKAEEEEYARNHFGDWYVDLVYKKPYEEWDKQSLEAAERRFGKDRTKWPRTVSIFLGQMVAASEGVTLTQADTLLFNDLDYMPSRHLQAEDRIYRLSKKGAPPHDTVYIGYVLADSPLDQYLASLLFEKSGEIDDIYGGVAEDPEKVANLIRKEFMQRLAAADQAYKAGKKRKRKRKKRRNPSMPPLYWKHTFTGYWERAPNTGQEIHEADDGYGVWQLVQQSKNRKPYGDVSVSYKDEGAEEEWGHGIFPTLAAAKRYAEEDSRKTHSQWEERRKKLYAGRDPYGGLEL